MASSIAVSKIRELSISLGGTMEEKKDLLKKCAMTTLNSKLVIVTIL
jgi:T-complex protein 1 subunit eta